MHARWIHTTLCFVVCILAGTALLPASATASQEVSTKLHRIFGGDPAACDSELTPDPKVNEKIDVDCIDDYRVDATVAIVDAGVDLEHPDLNVVEGADCTEAKAPTYICTSGPGDGDADWYHGTGLAEMVGAIDNSVEWGEGAGVAPGVEIWALDMLEGETAEEFEESQQHFREGKPWEPLRIPLDAGIAAVKYATAHADEIEILHYALGCGADPEPDMPMPVCLDEEGQVAVAKIEVLEDAITEAIEAGLVVTTPAGNYGRNVQEAAGDGIPSRHPDVITTSAIADTDGLPGGKGPLHDAPCSYFEIEEKDDTNADYSHYGAAIDIASVGPCTSGANAWVSGAAALLASRSQFPTEDAADVKAIRDALVGAGNTKSAAEGGWDDESGDGFKEPLLDVSDEELFDPVMTPGCDIAGAPVESDVDGDGHSDLVTLHPDGSVTVHGGGAGASGLQFASGVDSFSEESPLSSALYIGSGDHVVDVADVSGDGCADLVTVDADSGDAVVYRGRPDRGFGSPITSLAGALQPALLKAGGDELIAVADVTGDGESDLVSHDDQTKKITVHPGTYEGSFGTGATTSETVDSALHTGSGEYFVDAGDVTGDGRADLVSLTTSKDLHVRPGEANGTFAAATSSQLGLVNPALDDGSGREPYGLGDVTGDGKTDLVLGEAGSAYVYPAQSGGDLGRFGSPKASFGGNAPSSTFGTSSAFEVGGVLDVNGDGRGDLFAADAKGQVRVVAGNADGSLAGSGVSFSEGFFKSTQHFQNQNAAGSEIVVEKPALRRRGCASNGCYHTTASAALVSGFGTTGRNGSYSIHPSEPDGDVLQRFWHPALGWSGWGWHGSPPGGQATSESAAASTQGADHFFVRGADGAIWQRTWSDAAGKWSEWSSLGGTFASGTAPAAVSPTPGTLQVFARATNDAIQRKIWTEASGWGSWQEVPETSGTGLAVAYNGIINFFVRDSSGDVVQRWCCPQPGIWSSLGWHGAPPGGPATSAPATTSVTTSVPKIDHLFVRGADRALWEKTWNGKEWSAWTSLGGVLRSGPSAVATASGEVHVFVRAANDSYWRKRWIAGEGWSQWEPVY